MSVFISTTPTPPPRRRGLRWVLPLTQPKEEGTTLGAIPDTTKEGGDYAGCHP